MADETVYSENADGEMAQELTREQAVALSKSGFWKELSLEEIARFQLFESRLCMPFPVFHEAVEKTLGRPVYTHEFAYAENLQKELLGDAKAPTFAEILDLIPADKRVIIAVTGDPPGPAQIPESC